VALDELGATVDTARSHQYRRRVRPHGLVRVLGR